MLKKIMLFLGCLCMLASIPVNATPTTETTTTEKVAVSREKIVDWIQKEWKVPSTVFDQTEERVKSEFTEKDDSVKSTIRVLDLAVHQLKQKSGGKKEFNPKDLEPPIADMIAKCKTGHAWGEVAKEVGIAGGASELNHRAFAIQHGEVPGPKPAEQVSTIPILSEEQIVQRLNKEFGISGDLYRQVKSRIPADESSNALKILVLAIYEVDSGQGTKPAHEERQKKIEASAARFTDLHYKGNEGWGDLSTKAGFPTGGDVNRIKGQIEKGEPVVWPATNK